MSRKWNVLYRFPPTGPPLVLILESATAILVKMPMVTNTDHVMVTKEPKAFGKHLTDETVEAGEGRNRPLGKMTSATIPTGLLESLTIEFKDDEIIYVFDSSTTSSMGPCSRKDVPNRDLSPRADLLRQLATVDLDTVPFLRKATWGEARRSSLPHGLRKESGDLVLYMQRLNGKVIRFPFIAKNDKLPVIAEVSGLGALFERAKGRLPGPTDDDEAPDH